MLCVGNLTNDGGALKQLPRNNKNTRPCNGINAPTPLFGFASLTTPGLRLLARFVNQMVASVYSVPASRLIDCHRGKANASRARQISIYLMHTSLSLSYVEIGRVYHKDRTTIVYACKLIEDLRDEPAFDEKLVELENTIHTVLSLACTGAPKGQA